MTWTLPKTWNVGDPATSADLNTYLRDNSTFLYGDAAYIAPTLTSGHGWQTSAGAPAGYRKVGTRVLFRGDLQNGVSGTVAFVLPAGYRPTQVVLLQGYGTQLSVDTSGNVAVTTTAGSTTFVLDGLYLDTI